MTLLPGLRSQRELLLDAWELAWDAVDRLALQPTER